MLIVDMYATIPIVKPTHLSETYLSAIPCGHPDQDDLSDMRGALMDAIARGGYDDNLVRFLLFADWSADVQDGMILQHIYQASRTYLDYLDGAYLDGDSIHVPVLPNRPYLCTVIAPNTLESQYMVYGLPFASSYVSLGGTEGTAHAKDVTESAEFGRVVGVQSPRDGIVSLDITASIGAAVSVLGTGDANPARTNHTGQWLNGTIGVAAKLGVGAAADADWDDLTPLAEFGIDLYDIVEESYLLDDTDSDGITDRCYGRFTTLFDYDREGRYMTHRLARLLQRRTIPDLTYRRRLSKITRGRVRFVEELLQYCDVHALAW